MQNKLVGLNHFYNAVLIIIFFFVNGCDDRSLILDPNNNFTYSYSNFFLNQDSTHAFRLENYNPGLSPYFYIGNVNDSTKSYALIKINPQIINQYEFCNDLNDTTILSINNIKFRIMTPDLSEDFVELNNKIFQDTTTYPSINENNSIPDGEIITNELIYTPFFINAYFFSEIDNIISNYIENDISIHDTTTINTLINLLGQSNERILPFEIFNNQPPYNLSYLYYNLNDFISIEDLCINTISQFYIILEYNPLLENSRQYIEFYSTDHLNINVNPALFIDYNMKTQDVNKINKYSINQITSEIINENNFIYNDSILSNTFGTIISFDIPDSNFNLNNIQNNQNNLDADSLNILIPATEQSVSLFDVQITLNQEYLDSINDIAFYFDDVYFAKKDLDPSNDNWDETDSTGTELNGNYDLGELFFDYGYDNCLDEDETGIGMDFTGLSIGMGCDTSSNFIPIYNPDGTENNLLLDWEDQDENGVWNEGEGEKWYDYGEDQTNDLFESGCINDSSNISIDTTYLYILSQISPVTVFYDTTYQNITICGPLYWEDNNCTLCSYSDPHGDNYNIDPSEDNWNVIDSTGTEGNGSYDLGEPFLDFGVDQIPDSLEAYIDYEYQDDNWNEEDSTGTENNNSYDVGEIYFDTGLDSLFSYQEFRYNVIGKENNLVFDSNYESFDDFGEDNIASGELGDNTDDDYNNDPNNDVDYENNGILDFYDSGLDRCTDNYEDGDGGCNDYETLGALDPNGDNYNAESQPDSTEGNGQWDWKDQNGNSIFDLEFDMHEISEYYSDYGIDGLPDTLEQNYYNNYVNYTLGTNLVTFSPSYFETIDDSLMFETILIDSNDNAEVALWISQIKKIDEYDYILSLELMTLADITGLQLQLNHEHIYEVYDTTTIQSTNFYPYQFDDLNDNSYPDQNEIIDDAEKYIQDYSFYPLNSFNEDSLIINNGNGIRINLVFDGFNDFISTYNNSALAYDQTKLILYFNQDNLKHNIHDEIDLNFEIYDVTTNDYISFDEIEPKTITNETDSISINIGPLLQKYLLGELHYEPLTNNAIRLKSSNYSNNFYSIFIENNDDINRMPRLEVFYQE